jgi:hypothetical protein
MSTNTLLNLIVACTAAVAAGAALSSCRTTVFDADHCPVEVQTNGTASVDGRMCRVEDVARRLASAGFSKDITVRVGVPNDVTPEVMARVSSVLASGGYTRFCFVKPLQKESFAKDGKDASRPAQKPRAKPAGR